jgi:uroporphyrinogen decarboxylase
MNGKQRVEAMLLGEQADRVPVLASTLAHAAWMRGVPQSRIHTNATVLAETVLDAARALELDGVYLSSDNWIVHEALGGRVVFPDDDEPWGTHGPLVNQWSDLTALRVPDPQYDGRMPMMLQAARHAVELAKDDLYIEANIDSGPFQLALMMRGAQQGYIDLMEEPDRFSDLMEFGLQAAIAYGRAMARIGVHAIQFGESSASMVGARVFRDLILPYDRRLIAALQAENVKAVLHVCGNSTHLLDSLGRSGADWLEIDALVNLEDAFLAVGSGVTIRGNVDTVLLLNGPVGRVSQAARDCIATAERMGGRLILSPGCGVPKFTPAEHVRALVDAANRYGAIHNTMTISKA